MSFWVARDGSKLTGDEQSSFASSFRSLPDNTQCHAMIKSFTRQEYDGEVFFQIIWQIMDGDFKGCNVKQRITPYDPDENRHKRNLNMLYRIFNLCNHKPTHANEPNNDDLAPMKHSILSIKIGNGIVQGQDRTWVREVHAEGVLEVATGLSAPVVTGTPGNESGREESAFDRQRKREQEKKAKESDDLDIPF